MDVTPKYKVDLARDLRQCQTPSEARLWQAFRGHKVNGLGFRRQHPIGRFVADFCCNDAKLIIEVDGAYHLTPLQRELDRERAAHFTGRGYTVLRVSADDVMMRLDEVLKAVRRHASPRPAPIVGTSPHPLPLPRRGGRGESETVNGVSAVASPIAATVITLELPSPAAGEGQGVGAGVRTRP